MKFAYEEASAKAAQAEDSAERAYLNYVQHEEARAEHLGTEPPEDAATSEDALRRKYQIDGIPRHLAHSVAQTEFSASPTPDDKPPAFTETTGSQ